MCHSLCKIQFKKTADRVFVAKDAFLDYAKLDCTPPIKQITYISVHEKIEQITKEWMRVSNTHLLKIVLRVIPL